MFEGATVHLKSGFGLTGQVDLIDTECHMAWVKWQNGTRCKYRWSELVIIRTNIAA